MKEVVLKKDQKAAVTPLTKLEEPIQVPMEKTREGYTAMFAQPMKLFPYVFGLVFLLLWQFRGIHTLFSLERYQLPIPSDIITAMRENGDILLHLHALHGCRNHRRLPHRFAAGLACCSRGFLSATSGCWCDFDHGLAQCGAHRGTCTNHE